MYAPEVEVLELLKDRLPLLLLLLPLALLPLNWAPDEGFCVAADFAQLPSLGA